MHPTGTENPFLQILFFLLLFFHLGIAGFLVGGSGISFLLQVNGIRGGHLERRQLAASLLSRSAPGAGFLLLVPILGGLNLLALEAAYDPGFDRIFLRAGMALLLLSGLLLIYLSRLRTADKAETPLAAPAAGLVGTLLLLGAYFLFCCELALLLRPEKWPILSSLPVLILSWSGFGKFLEFVSMALAFAGIALLFESRAAGDAERERIARRLGTVAATVAFLMLPVGIFFDIFNMISLAFSVPLFSALATVLVLAGALVWRLAGFWDSPGRGMPHVVTGGLLLILLMLFGADHLARGNILIPQTLQRPAGVETPSRRQAPAAVEAKQEEADGGMVSGEAVFERVCSSCHAFDRRVVGPPLNEVVPGYGGDRAALEEFIRNPVKVNPDYPAMPKLGLPPEEIEAVAGYLLEQAEG